MSDQVRDGRYATDDDCCRQPVAHRVRTIASVQELQKVLGKDVTFDSLEVTLLGGPGFVAKEFRIADDPRFAATPLVRARELILGISLWQLFFQRLVINSLTFNEPEFQIITDQTGLRNLTTLLQRKNEYS